MYATIEFNSVELEAALKIYCERTYGHQFKQVEFIIKNNHIEKVLVKERLRNETAWNTIN